MNLERKLTWGRMRWLIDVQAFHTQRETQIPGIVIYHLTNLQVWHPALVLGHIVEMFETKKRAE